MKNTRLYKKTIRLDEETVELIEYLKHKHISWQKLIIDDIKNILKTKAQEIDYKYNCDMLPF